MPPKVLSNLNYLLNLNFDRKLSLINLGAIMAGAADIPAFRSMRTLRALRPLRAVSRWEGMRVSS